MKNTKIVELVIEEDSQALAIDAISLVSAPAIETDFVFFGKEKNNLTFAKVDEEKRMLVSPALIPNKQIFRYDANKDQEYYVYFSPATVQKASELYLKHNNHHKATYEHQDRVAGVLTIESWIIDNPKMDKSKLYGFNLPKGTWMVKMKIENDELWEKIKSGELKGLSIEGYFIDKMQKMSEKKPTDAEILTALNEIIRENKTELKSKKVEFADYNYMLGDNAQDAAKSFQIIKSTSEELEERLSKLNKSRDVFEKDLDKSKSYLQHMKKNVVSDAQKNLDIHNSILDKVTKQLQDLGLNVKDLPTFSRADKQYKELKTALKTVKGLLSKTTSSLKKYS
jgi:hypothetical protein